MNVQVDAPALYVEQPGGAAIAEFLGPRRRNRRICIRGILAVSQSTEPRLRQITPARSKSICLRSVIAHHLRSKCLPHGVAGWGLGAFAASALALRDHSWKHSWSSTTNSNSICSPSHYVRYWSSSAGRHSTGMKPKRCRPRRVTCLALDRRHWLGCCRRWRAACGQLNLKPLQSAAHRARLPLRRVSHWRPQV